MRRIREFWRDEAGLVMSAEAVTIATLGVIGASVGMKAAATALNEELKEVAFAVRSLDQSYSFNGYCSGTASVAGSCYQQQDVAASLAELQVEIEKLDAQQQDDSNELPRRSTTDRREPPAPPQPERR